MMLGGRFDIGATPKGLSPELVARIREVEAGLSEDHKSQARWTLTWLEGRATVTLDGGVTLREGD
jgi:hypothetical protein